MSEATFIADLQAGKREAFSRLLDEYQQQIFYACLSFVPNVLQLCN